MHEKGFLKLKYSKENEYFKKIIYHNFFKIILKLFKELIICLFQYES